MTTRTAFEATGIDAEVTVTFKASPGATTLIGGAVAADLLSSPANTKYAVGDVTIASATKIRVRTAAWAIPAGTYSLQVRAEPAGYSEQTYEYQFVIKKSAAVQA